MARLDYHEKQIILRTREVWAQARAKFYIPFLPHGIKVLLATDLFIATNDEDNVNRFGCPAVGQAHLYVENGFYGAAIIYNRKAIKQNPGDMLNDTVPHELAHIIRYACGDIEVGHNEDWQTACIALGGSGKATYDTGQYNMRLTKLQKLAYKLAKPLARRGTFQHVLEPSVI